MADALDRHGQAVEPRAVGPLDRQRHARKHPKYVAGLTGHPAASGDPSPVTAEGVFRGMALAVQRAYGSGLDGLTVAIQGVGHVGGILADKLHAAGARLIVTDVNEAQARAVAERTGAEITRPEAIFDARAEVFAPCALGGAINAETLPRLKARVIAGGANNQLATLDAGQALYEKGLTYVPDYVINGGGIINVAAEIRALDRGEAYDPAWVEAKLSRLMTTLEEVLQRSKDERRPTHAIAGEIARARIAEGRGGRG